MRKKNHARHRPLRLGFVALADCAPIVMAFELGLFAKSGLEIELRREVGWATVRDKIIYGELDAAQAPAGLMVAASCGLGSVSADCLTGLILNLHGNAITLSQRLWKRGIHDGASLGVKRSSAACDAHLASFTRAPPIASCWVNGCALIASSPSATCKSSWFRQLRSTRT
jgi:ABC-type nitrate/sulfonate/bicarbonate transport system substrate-binding protein